MKIEHWQQDAEERGTSNDLTWAVASSWMQGSKVIYHFRKLFTDAKLPAPYFLSETMERI